MIKRGYFYHCIFIFSCVFWNFGLYKFDREKSANSFALHIIVIFAAILKRHIYCITQQFFCGYIYIIIKSIRRETLENKSIYSRDIKYKYI